MWNSWKVIAYIEVGHWSQFLSASWTLELLGSGAWGMREEGGSWRAGAYPQMFLFGKAGSGGTFARLVLWEKEALALRAKFRWCAANCALHGCFPRLHFPNCGHVSSCSGRTWRCGICKARPAEGQVLVSDSQGPSRVPSSSPSFVR